MVQVAVLGAGPTGLEAALAAAERGWDVTVYEAAPHVGAYVRAWGHVRLFTPWSMDVSPRAARVLGVPEGPCPTGEEYARHLDRVAALLPDVRLSTRVLQVAREGLLKHEEIGTADRGGRRFRLLVEGPDGGERLESADVVLDCTGTYGSPNPTGDGGIPAPGERALAHRVERGIPGSTRRGRGGASWSWVRATARRRPPATWSPPGRSWCGRCAGTRRPGVRSRTTRCPTAQPSWRPAGGSPTARWRGRRW